MTHYDAVAKETVVAFQGVAGSVFGDPGALYVRPVGEAPSRETHWPQVRMESVRCTNVPRNDALALRHGVHGAARPARVEVDFYGYTNVFGRDLVDWWAGIGEVPFGNLNPGGYGPHHFKPSEEALSLAGGDPSLRALAVWGFLTPAAVARWEGRKVPSVHRDEWLAKHSSLSSLDRCAAYWQRRDVQALWSHFWGSHMGWCPPPKKHT